MSRFPNKLVMGGSDRESTESEDEYYMPGQEMANLYAQQYMYNATMYNVMIQNMMPCVPMPCLPAYGYPMPYPSMITNRPVNHAMAAGHYYEKGGRSRRRRKSRSKGDGNIYRTSHHRQHRVVSRHRYYEYEPSSESDNEDGSIYTGEKGVQACRSVNRQMSADKSDNTLRRLNPGQSGNGVKQQRLQNNWPNKEFEPSPPLQSNSGKSVQNVSLDIAADLPLNQVRHDSNNSQLNGRTDSTERASQVIPADESQIAAVLQNLPSSDPGISNQNAVVVNSECQQEQHKVADMNVADDQRQTAASVQDVIPVCVPPEENTAANSLLLSCSPPYKVATDTVDESNEPLSGSQLTQIAAQIASISSRAVETIVSRESGRVMSSPSLQRHSNTTVQASRSKQNGSTSGHQEDAAKVKDWRNTKHNLKCLQSLHSLRKMWAEWETKYRPPPVSVYTD